MRTRDTTEKIRECRTRCASSLTWLGLGRWDCPPSNARARDSCCSAARLQNRPMDPSRGRDSSMVKNLSYTALTVLRCGDGVPVCEAHTPLFSPQSQSSRPPTSISSVYFDTLRPDSRASMKVCYIGLTRYATALCSHSHLLLACSLFQSTASSVSMTPSEYRATLDKLQHLEVESACTTTISASINPSTQISFDEVPALSYRLFFPLSPRRALSLTRKRLDSLPRGSSHSSRQLEVAAEVAAGRPRWPPAEGDIGR